MIWKQKSSTSELKHYVRGIGEGPNMLALSAGAQDAAAAKALGDETLQRIAAPRSTRCHGRHPNSVCFTPL
jgi:hypothetical protein